MIRLDPEDDGSTSLRLAHSAMIGAPVVSRYGPGLVAIGWELALVRLAAATGGWRAACLRDVPVPTAQWRSEEHTSELQSRGHLVCRLLLEKKKKTRQHDSFLINA